MAYALKETLATKRLEKDTWFRFWTIIGPCCTQELVERALFTSEQAAKQSRAYTHPLSFFEPVEVEASEGGDFDWNKP